MFNRALEEYRRAHSYSKVRADCHRHHFELCESCACSNTVPLFLLWHGAGCGVGSPRVSLASQTASRRVGSVTIHCSLSCIVFHHCVLFVSAGDYLDSNKRYDDAANHYIQAQLHSCLFAAIIGSQARALSSSAGPGVPQSYQRSHRSWPMDQSYAGCLQPLLPRSLNNSWQT